MQGLALILIFAFANVVAAGVWQVLVLLLHKMAPQLSSPWPFLLIGGLAAVAAVLFVRGAMDYASRIQCRPGRRGG